MIEYVTIAVALIAILFGSVFVIYTIIATRREHYEEFRRKHGFED